MKRTAWFLAFALGLFDSTTAIAGLKTPSQDGGIFVCKETGKNRNAGTKQAPLKNIDKAIKVAKSGQSIFVCGGTYMGTFNIGYLESDKPFKLYGSYDKSFSHRSLSKTPTLFQPDNASGAKSRKALLSFKRAIDGIVIDGMVFDMGLRNAYSYKEAPPKGVATGRLLLPPQKERGDSATVTQPCVSIPSAAQNGSVTITNNVFANCANNAIQAGLRQGTFIIQNNVFVANRMSSVEVYGTCRAKGHGPRAKLETECGHLDFGYNTVLFTWSRLKDFKDMGYGVRVMTGVSYNIHHNLFGGNVLAGVDHTRFSALPVRLDNNGFFANKEADLYYSPASNTQLRLRADQFEDLELASVSGNMSTMPKGLPVDLAYLDGFLNARYSEKADYSPDSPANTLREAMGLNKRGKLTTKVTMYGNRYEVTKALGLFGAIAGKGAQ